MHSHVVIVHNTIIKAPMVRPSDFKHYSVKRITSLEHKRSMGGLREHLRGRVTQDMKTRLLGALITAP